MRVVPGPNFFKLFNLIPDVDLILNREPGSLDIDLFPIAKPSRPGFVYRPLEGYTVSIRIPEHSGFRMKQGSLAPWVVRPARWVERESDTNFQEVGRDHPGHCPQTMPCYLVRLGAPSPGQAKEETFLVPGFEALQQCVLQRRPKSLSPFLVRGRILR